MWFDEEDHQSSSSSCCLTEFETQHDRVQAHFRLQRLFFGCLSSNNMNIHITYIHTYLYILQFPNHLTVLPRVFCHKKGDICSITRNVLKDFDVPIAAAATKTAAATKIVTSLLITIIYL